MKKEQKEEIVKKIAPLVEGIADERVQKVMNEVQKQQIKAYEDFFQGQEERFSEILSDELEHPRTRDKIKNIVKEVLKDAEKDN